MRILSSLRKGGDRSAHACFFTKNCQETEDKLLFCRPSSRSSVWRRCAAHPLKSSRWREIVFSFSYILRQLLNSRQTTFDGQLGRFGSQVGQKWAWKNWKLSLKAGHRKSMWRVLTSWLQATLLELGQSLRIPVTRQRRLSEVTNCGRKYDKESSAKHTLHKYDNIRTRCSAACAFSSNSMANNTKPGISSLHNFWQLL